MAAVVGRHGDHRGARGHTHEVPVRINSRDPGVAGRPGHAALCDVAGGVRLVVLVVDVEPRGEDDRLPLGQRRRRSLVGHFGDGSAGNGYVRAAGHLAVDVDGHGVGLAELVVLAQILRFGAIGRVAQGHIPNGSGGAQDLLVNQRPIRKVEHSGYRIGIRHPALSEVQEHRHVRHVTLVVEAAGDIHQFVSIIRRRPVAGRLKVHPSARGGLVGEPVTVRGYGDASDLGGFVGPLPFGDHSDVLVYGDGLGLTDARLV